MSLKSQLDTIRAGAEKMIPPDKYATMQRATATLRATGILDSVLGVGARLPAFSLPNTRGETLSSGDLLGRGPVVLTVFRGHW